MEEYGAAVLESYFRNAPEFAPLVVLSRSYHGRVREEATRRLGELCRSDTLPALIERLNDWVPQVRAAAHAAIEPLIVERHAHAFIQNLVQLQQLRVRGRDDHARFIARIEAFLAAAPQRTHVLAALSHQDHRIARICLQIATKHALLSDVERAEIGLSHGDLAFALDALALVAKMPATQRRAFAERALDHASAPVRRDALRILLSDGIAQQRIENFAFDRHSALRALAARHLRNSGVDITAHYRAELASTQSRRLRIAIEGVAAHGTTDDVLSLRPLLAHPAPAIRRCALVAWTNKLGFDATDAVVAALSDPAPSVARDAARLAEIVRPQFDADTLLALSDSPAWAENDGRLMAAFGYSNKWELLIFVMQRLARMPGPAEQAAMLIRYWETRTAGSSAQPKPAQIARLERILNDGGARLLSTLYRTRFDFMLRSLGVELVEPAVSDPAPTTAGHPNTSAQGPGLLQRLIARWRQR